VRCARFDVCGVGAHIALTAFSVCGELCVCVWCDVCVLCPASVRCVRCVSAYVVIRRVCGERVVYVVRVCFCGVFDVCGSSVV
jgi:hypothetical protein